MKSSNTAWRNQRFMTPLLYEIEHGIGTDHFMLYECENHVFPIHMHRCYEFVLMLSGSMTVRLNGKDILMHQGDLMLIKPNYPHSYDCAALEQSKCIICVFSNDLIAAVAEPLAKYQLHAPVLHNVSEAYVNMFRTISQDSDLATLKGFLYTICGLFYQRLNWNVEDTEAKDTLLLRDILVYLENHISQPCTLKGTAESLGYHPAYISRYFAQTVGMPFYTYVQHVKVDRACYLLHNTRDSVLSIAMQCGFSSLSSFNRTFKATTGITPREYRQSCC